MVHLILFAIIITAYALKNYREKYQVIPFIILFLFSAVRYQYGNDYNSYLRRFNLIKIGVDSSNIENGYEFLNKIFPNFYLLIVALSFFYIAVIYWLIKNNVKKEYIWISIFIFCVNPYLFLINLSALRQCIAICLFVIATEHIIKKNLVKYIAIILLAGLFHQSALLLLPVYFVINTKSFNRKHVAVIVVIVAVLLFRFNISELVNKVIGWLGNSSYAYYASSDRTNSLRATILSSLYMIYVLLNINKISGKKAVYIKLYLIGSILGVVAFRMSMITRIQMYFDIFSVVAIPSIIERIPMTGRIYIKRNRPIATVLDLRNRYILPCTLVLIYLLRYYSFFTNPMWSSFRTYKTILSLI